MKAKKLLYSTSKSRFGCISAGLIKNPKNKEKDSNSSNACLFTSALFRIQQLGSCKRHAQMGITLVTKFGNTLDAIVVSFCRLSNPIGNKLGCHRSHSKV